MPSPLPKVSLCTVTHNRARFLPLLQKQVLAQTYPHDLLEWVILDDSTDGSRVHVQPPSSGPAIHYERLPSKVPLGKKRNLSHARCSGEIIVYMDDDDFYPPSRVAHAVKRLLTSDALIAGSTILPIYFLKEAELWLSGPFGTNHATAASFAFKRELLERTRYNDTATQGEEREFLQNYTIPMVQLDPGQTVICIAHNANTFDKTRLKSQGNPRQCRQAPPETQASLQAVHGEALKAYAALIQPASAPPAVPAQPGTAYCITMAEAQQRQTRLAAHLSTHQLKPLFLHGTSPATLPPIRRDGPILNRPKQLAALTSHLRLLHAIGASATADEQAFLILEDDAVLHPEFQTRLHAVTVPDDWEILQLGCMHPGSLTRLLALADQGIACIRWEQIFWGCHAYVVKARAARRVAARYLPGGTELNLTHLHRPTACVPDFLIYDAAVSYTLCRPLANQDLENCPTPD